MATLAVWAGIYCQYVLHVVLWRGVLMGIMDAANDLVEQGKAALDANADGNVELKEVADAVVAQAKGIADAAASAVDGVKQDLDIDGVLPDGGVKPIFRNGTSTVVSLGSMRFDIR